MVEIAAARGKFRTPFGKALQPFGAIVPFALRIRRVGKARGVQQHLFDRDHVLAVGAELGNDLGHAFAHVELALADQQPRRRRHYRLGAGEDGVERVVGGGTVGAALHRVPKGAHRADLAVARDCDLARRQQALVDFARSALEQRVDLLRIEAGFAGTFGKKLVCGHRKVSPGGFLY